MTKPTENACKCSAPRMYAGSDGTLCANCHRRDPFPKLVAPIAAEEGQRGKWDELRKAAEAATPGPWEYRPKQFDDWGFVRAGLNGWLVARAEAGGYTTSEDCDVHRANGTDPYGANANFISLANPAAILELLNELESQPLTPSVTMAEGEQTAHVCVYDSDVLTMQYGENLPPDVERYNSLFCRCGRVNHYGTWLPPTRQHRGEMDALTETQKMRGRAVTHDEAQKAAHRLINSHFGNKDQARCSIPAQAIDDDVTVIDYIREQRAKAESNPGEEGGER